MRTRQPVIGEPPDEKRPRLYASPVSSVALPLTEIVWASAPVSNSPSLTPIAPLKPSAPVRASVLRQPARATRSR